MPLESGEKVLLFVNGMGGTPLLELYVAHRRVVKHLEERGVRAARHLVGNFITSLDMQGMSVTLLRATPEQLKLWDAPVVTPALRRSGMMTPSPPKAATERITAPRLRGSVMLSKMTNIPGRGFSAA